jgi:hypothetical protein
VWLYIKKKATSHGIEKHVFTLHIHPELHKLVTSLFSSVLKNYFLAEFPFRKRYFISARHTFAVKFPLFCTIFISDLQQTLNNQV